MSAPVHAFAPFAAALDPLLRAAFPDREVVCWSKPAELAAGLPDAEFLITIFTPPTDWALATRMRLIQGMGAGVDDVLPAQGLRAGAVIANNRGAAAPAMSEFGLTLVLALLKQLPLAARSQRERSWTRFLAEPAEGRTLGILGAGAIGIALAEKARCLGMRVLATQRNPRRHPAIEQTFGPEQTEAVLAESDVVVVLLPLTDQTRGFLSAERIAQMKPGARLVNLARGGIVDERAVQRALEDGRLAGAAFDVFANEPLPADDPFWDAPNLIVTPHVAGGFPDYLPRVVELFAENVARLERGEPPRNEVDRVRGY